MVITLHTNVIDNIFCFALWQGMMWASVYISPSFLQAFDILHAKTCTQKKKNKNTSIDIHNLEFDM